MSVNKTPANKPTFARPAVAATLGLGHRRLLGSTALVLAGCLAFSSPAWANDECGLAPTVTCDSSGNNYTSGITYDVTDLTMIVETGVVIAPNVGIDGISIDSSSGTINLTLQYGASITTAYNNSPSGADGIFIYNAQSVTLKAYGDITTSAYYSEGVGISDTAGNVTVVASGNIYTSGPSSGGIAISRTGGTVNVTASGTITTQEGDAIAVDVAAGDVTVTASGSITTGGSSSNGIHINNAGGNAIVTLYGDIITDGITGSHGVYVASTDGYVKTTVSGGGSITTYSAYAHGIYISGTGDGTDPANEFVEVSVSGDITTSGKRSYGIYVYNSSGDVDVTVSGNITTSGSSSDAIDIYNTSGYVDVEAIGNITTSGSGSEGIAIYNTDESVDVAVSGSISTSGTAADGIDIGDTADRVDVTISGDISTSAQSSFGVRVGETVGDVDLDISGSITTSGLFSDGIFVTTAGSNVDVTVSGSVTASGIRANAISISGSEGDVNLSISGAVSGGNSYLNGNGVGVYLNNPDAVSSTITIESGGTLGALSDVAIRSFDRDLVINNSYIITGYILLYDGNDTFNNNAGGVWELRNYADTDGDGERDTEDTASVDFGDGDDSFTNSGILRLSQVSSSGSIGELINLEGFENAAGGVIDLADGEANDQLSISGTFVSTSGSLELDVLLDDGASPEADLLILEEAVSDAEPTLVYINNVGGQGGLTSGNGIRVIEIENTSEDDAFALGERVVAGAYEYELEQVGLDWYLQSTLLFEGGAEYPALLSGALLAFHADIAPLQQRLRQAGENGPAIEPASWNGATHALGPWLQVSALRQEVDTSSPYGQTIARLNMGIDGELQGLRSGRLFFGGFAGFGHAEQDFDGSDTESESRNITAGLHTRYSTDAVYGQAIVKYEHQNARIDSVAADQAPFDVDLLGLSIETGVQLGSPVLSLTPYARLTYLHAWAGSFEDDSGATIDLKNAESLRGELGLRLGKDLWQGTTQGHAALDAGLRHEFSGETEATVSGLNYSDELPGTLGVIAADVSVALLDEQLTLAFRGEYAKGDEAEEFGASLSLNLDL